MTRVDFSTFVDQQYRGIPEQTSTIEDKQRAIKAKKAILKHPDCPNSSKAKIKEEIATIENEIKEMQAQEHAAKMNKSIFDS